MRTNKQLFIIGHFLMLSFFAYSQKDSLEVSENIDHSKSFLHSITFDVFDLAGNLGTKKDLYFFQRMTIEGLIGDNHLIGLSPSFSYYYGTDRKDAYINDKVYELLIFHKYARDNHFTSSSPIIGYYLDVSYISIDEKSNFDEVSNSFLSEFITQTWYYGGGLLIGYQMLFDFLKLEIEMGLGMGKVMEEELDSVLSPQIYPNGAGIEFYASFFNINFGYKF